VPPLGPGDGYVTAGFSARPSLLAPAGRTAMKQRESSHCAGASRACRCTDPAGIALDTRVPAVGVVVP
jgi:hypothetical protein